MSTGSFMGVKRPGRGVDHRPPSSADVKERVELYLYTTSGPSWPVLGWPLPLPFFYQRTKTDTGEISLVWCQLFWIPGWSSFGWGQTRTSWRNNCPRVVLS